MTSGLVYLSADIETLIRNSVQPALPLHSASSAPSPPTLAAVAPAEPQHATQLPASDTSSRAYSDRGTGKHSGRHAGAWSRFYDFLGAVTES